MDAEERTDGYLVAEDWSGCEVCEEASTCEGREVRQVGEEVVEDVDVAV
jgi:hypothetical protein